MKIGFFVLAQSLATILEKPAFSTVYNYRKTNRIVKVEGFAWIIWFSTWQTVKKGKTVKSIHERWLLSIKLKIYQVSSAYPARACLHILNYLCRCPLNPNFLEMWFPYLYTTLPSMVSLAPYREG